MYAVTSTRIPFTYTVVLGTSNVILSMSPSGTYTFRTSGSVPLVGASIVSPLDVSGRVRLTGASVDGSVIGSGVLSISVISTFSFTTLCKRCQTLS